QSVCLSTSSLSDSLALLKGLFRSFSMSHVQPWTTPSRALGCRFERSRFLEEKQGVPTSSFQIAPMRDVVFQGSVPGELKLGGEHSQAEAITCRASTTKTENLCGK